MIRFWEKVDVRGEDDCWEWLLSKNIQTGYGQVAMDGTVKVTHRVAYELSYGPIPGGMIVMHTCDNRPCCNPNHLRLGTDQDNMDDKYAKGRANHPKGVDLPQARLTEEQVLKIYSDPRTQQAIANEYGVSRMQISHIKTGKRWAHLTKS